MADRADVTWTVVVPVKGTAASKSRLGASSELVMAIALDSVEAALESARVIVVTTAEAAQQFEALGATVIEDAGGGLVAACGQGVAAAGSGPVAVMLGDVPALRSRELDGALQQALEYAISFVADADADGTVLIAALDSADHSPAFGEHSRAAHLAAGYVELDVGVDSGLRRDVDTRQQLEAIPIAALGSRTRRVLSPDSV